MSQFGGYSGRIAHYDLTKRGVTDLNWNEEELCLAGERIVQLERLFNLREGLVPGEDTLPHRFLSEPVPDGPGKGRIVVLLRCLKNIIRQEDGIEKQVNPCLNG